MTDTDGTPLDVGRRTRSIPPSMRRAIVARDRCCRFPGCDRTRWLQAHHIEHWAHGGETRLGNLVLLCHHHHQLVHEGGFTFTDGAGSDGDGFEVRTPHGHRLEPVPLQPSVLDDVVTDPARGLGREARSGRAAGTVPSDDEEAPDAPGPMSLFPRSAGAPWDLGYAVEALLDWTSPTILAGCP